MKLIVKRNIYYNGIIDEYDIYKYNNYGQEISHKNYFKESVYEKNIKEEFTLYGKTSYVYNTDNLLIKSIDYFEDANEIYSYKYKNNLLIKSSSNKEKIIYFYNQSNKLIRKEIYNLENKNLINFIIYKELDGMKIEEHYNNNNVLIEKYEEYFKNNLLVKTIDYKEDKVSEVKFFKYKDKLLLKEIIKKYLNGKEINEAVYYNYNAKNLLETEKRYINGKLNRIIEYVYSNDNYLKEIIDNNNLWGTKYTLNIILERIELDETPLLNKIKELKMKGFSYDYIENVLNINLEELKLDYL